MNLDTMLAEAAPARHLPLDGPDSPAAERLYHQITAQPPTPGRGPRGRRFARPALIAAAAAATAAAVALALLPGHTPARTHHGGQGSPALTAWTVTDLHHGVLHVTIRELRDPAGLRQALRADGVPANVKFLRHDFTATTSTRGLPKGCLNPRMSNRANAELQAKIMPMHPMPAGGVAVNIRPAAIPHGIGLYLKAWAASPATHSGPALTLQIDLVQATPQCTG
jgi:hypothetical protein